MRTCSEPPGRLHASRSLCTATCCGTAPATSWPTTAMTPGRSSTTSATALSSRRCATPRWRRIGSRGSGRTRALAPHNARRGPGLQPGASRPSPSLACLPAPRRLGSASLPAWPSRFEQLWRFGLGRAAKPKPAPALLLVQQFRCPRPLVWFIGLEFEPSSRLQTAGPRPCRIVAPKLPASSSSRTKGHPDFARDLTRPLAERADNRRHDRDEKCSDPEKQQCVAQDRRHH
jgi:hypothetical protein